jgi:thioredoxin 1
MSTFTIETEEDLEKMLDGHETVALDFWAKWCAPCRGFEPVFESVAKQNTDMAFCRVNIKDAPELKRAFEVKSTPTLAIIRDRVLVVLHTGYMDQKALSNLIEQVRTLDVAAVRKQAEADAVS